MTIYIGLKGFKCSIFARPYCTTYTFYWTLMCFEMDIGISKLIVLKYRVIRGKKKAVGTYMF